ncbi:MAG: hypothetical protein H0W64_08120 [Gammaproteobacteria bacterium]|nr:hypothetical protein [Gammaproteobacteria bacterium]
MFGVGQWLVAKISSVKSYTATTAAGVVDYATSTTQQAATYVSNTTKQTAEYVGTTSSNAVHYVAHSASDAVNYVTECASLAANYVVVTALDAAVTATDYASLAPKYAPFIKRYVIKTVPAIKASQHFVLSHFDVKEYWHGFSKFVDPKIIHKIALAPQTKKVLNASFRANILYFMGLSLLYEGGLKPMLRELSPAWKDSYPEKALNILPAAYAFCMEAGLYLSNTFAYPVILSKAIADDNKEINPSSKLWNKLATLWPSITSIAYNRTNLIMAGMMGYLTGSNAVKNFFIAKAYGQYYAELKLANKSTKERYRILNSNNAYTFGTGSFVLIASWLLENLVQRITGVRNDITKAAIFGIVSQYCLTVSLFNDEPLTKKKKGIDTFYHARLVTDSLMKQAIVEITNMLLQPSDSKVSVLTRIHDAKNLFLFYQFLFPDLFRRIGSLSKINPIQLFLEVYDATIRSMVKSARNLTSQTQAERTAHYLSWFPKKLITPEFRKEVERLFADLKDFFDGLDKLLDQEPMATLHDEGALQNLYTLYIFDPKTMDQELPKVTIHDMKRFHQYFGVRSNEILNQCVEKLNHETTPTTKAARQNLANFTNDFKQTKETVIPSMPIQTPKLKPESVPPLESRNAPKEMPQPKEGARYDSIRNSNLFNMIKPKQNGILPHQDEIIINPVLSKVSAQGQKVNTLQAGQVSARVSHHNLFTQKPAEEKQPRGKIQPSNSPLPTVRIFK